MSSHLSTTDLAIIRQEIQNEVRASLAALHNGRTASLLDEAESTVPTDRRSMLKKVGAIAAGVAAVGFLRPTTSQGANFYHAVGRGNDGSIPNTTGGSLILGQSNSASATDPTTIANATFTLSPSVFSIANYGSSFVGSPPSGVAAATIYSSSVGVTGFSGNLYGVYARSDGSNGGNAIGVYGLAGTTAAPAGTGVVGVGGVGVQGTGAGNGCGVQGISNGGTNAWGVDGNSTIGVGGQFAGGRSALYLNAGSGAVANPNVTPPSGGSTGDVYRGSTNGSLWYNAGGTNPYRQIAGADTAGTVHILATPRRYVDTRNGTGGATAPYGNGTVRSYNFVTLQAGTIPAGARGVFGNITAAAPGGAGNFQTNTSNSFPAGSASVMNFTPNVNLSNHFVGALDTTGQLFVKGNVFSGTGLVDLLIDIQGYFI